jgi:branched-subunit amino acid aminotransferase/4-amino-4-deoxychorismate lyase
VTPPAHEVLSGVTRDLVVRLAAREGIPVSEAPLALDSVTRWQECFITSTSRHVMPVISVDSETVGNGRPGTISQRLHALFEDYFRRATGG